ncbi:MAG: (2Fe-2S)-binding protein [Elusimicrobia bacterium]|nr:(2Fe-2S)-binding protein [Elusimicrobiota bacterium]
MPKTVKKSNAITASNGLFTVNFELNGVKTELLTKPGETLLDLLRRSGLRGTKKGCDTGDCGSCTIILDGKTALSCLMLAVQANGRKVTTIEGLGSPAEPHPIQTAFVQAGAVQCGFCIPGMILATKALLDKNPSPTEPEIRHALDGNLCRCTGYVKQVEAVQIAAQALKKQPKKKGK